MPVQKKPAAKKSSTKKIAEKKTATKKSTVKKSKAKKKVVVQEVVVVQSVDPAQSVQQPQLEQVAAPVATPVIATSPEAVVTASSESLVVSSSGSSHKLLFVILIILGLLVATTAGLFFFLPIGVAPAGWKNVAELKAYAATMDEFPKMDNSNIIKPDYTKFWTEKSKGGSSYLTKRLNRFLQFLRIKQAELWSVEVFKGQLERLAESRTKRGFTGNFIHKLIPNPGSQFVIVGDLQGAFHSLVCNIGKWIELGILNNEFKIVKPDARIVFIGNLVDRSPLSMDALSLVMRLMEENPDTVFVLRGNHEYKNYWHDYGFKQELMIRAASVSKEAIPLGDTVNKFFDTLSSAIFLGAVPNSATNFVSISHQGRSEDEKEMYPIDESGFVDFLKNPDKNLLTFNLKDAKPAGQSDIAIKAIIKSEKKRKTFQTMDGLRMLSPDKGSSAWSYLSCPTTSYQEGVKFFFDAFGIVEAAAEVENWSISLYNQDVRMRQGYKLKTFNLISGRQTAGEGATGAPAQAAAPVVQTTSVATQPVLVPVTMAVAQSAQVQSQPVTQAQPVVQAVGQPTPQQMAEYQAKLVEYNAKMAAYQAQQKQVGQLEAAQSVQVQPVPQAAGQPTAQQTAEYNAKMALYNAKKILYEAHQKKQTEQSAAAVQAQPIVQVAGQPTAQQIAEYNAKMALYNAKMVLYEAQKKQAEALALFPKQ